MIQSFQTQLEVTLRALTDVVLPALDPANRQALEQLQLSLATLNFLQARLPYARRYQRMELEHLIELAGKVIAVIGASAPATASLTQTMDNGRAELAKPQAEVEDYLRLSRELRELIADIVANSAGETFEDSLDALIVKSTQYLLLRERVWCLPLGFELAPQDLPDIEDLLE